jgi:hypothetical protein
MVSKKAAASKYDLIIRAKGTSSRILEIGQGSVRIESTSKGQAAGKLYRGTHWDTVESTMQPDNKKGIAAFTGQGTMWTSSPRLSQLNGARWSCDGDYNMNKETVEVRAKFDTHL